MEYSEFVADAQRSYVQLPDEKSELYKKNYIRIPDEYLSGNVAAGARNGEGDVIVEEIRRNLGLSFDICIANGNITGEHQNARIVDMSDVSAGEIAAKMCRSGDDKFSAFVNSSAGKAVFIRVGRNEKANIRILLLGVGASAFAQVLCDVEPGGELTLFEMCASRNSTASALGIVNEIRIGESAMANVHLIHNEDDKTAVINIHKAELGKDGKLVQHHVYTGGAYTKAKGSVTLNGDSAESDMNEIVLGSLNQRIDIATELVNFSKGSLGLLESKAVLTDTSRCILKGFAHIRQGAVGSRSMVEEKGLLLDDTAKIDSIPGMSVDEYDVKATHASATAPVEEEAVFYLTSRGIDRTTANRLLVDGFLGGSIGKIKDLHVRNAIASIIHDKVVNKRYGAVPRLSDENLLITFHDDGDEGDRIIQEHYKYRGA